MQTMMLVLLLSAPQLDLQSIERAEGTAYLEAREELLRRAPLAELELRRAGNRYDRRTWRSDAIADALHFWIARRADAERAYRLEGLQHSSYARRRRPAPEAARELVRLDAAPILFELLLKTMDHYPVQTEEERAALEDAVIVALGKSAHPAAPFALFEVANDPGRRASLRGLAAAQLRSEAELTALLQNGSFDVRYGALRGLAQVRTPTSVGTLVSAAEDPALRLAAIRALGSIASPIVLARTANPHADAIRTEASRALIAMIASNDRDHGDALVETLASIRDPSALDVLSKLERSDLVARAARRLERALMR